VRKLGRLLCVSAFFCTLLSITACTFPYSSKAEAAPLTLTPLPVATVTAVPTLPPVSTPTPFPTPQASPTLVPSPTLPTATAFVEPVGCERPPDDYTRLVVNGGRLNYRTFWMLRHAKALYKGTIDFTGWAITQGSYNPGGVAASFGTHDGGGAVDLSVINPRNGVVLRNEIPDAIRALRISGFAAWLRDKDELYKGSPIHIHAIAIGDAQLSQAAREQLTGKFAYFLGYNGLPQKEGDPPIPDRHGGPLLCQWMLDMGYRDMRQP
jgi:hypothetical protein